jgi:hypothetical protein
MLYRKINTVCSENLTKHTKNLCRQNVSMFHGKGGHTVFLSFSVTAGHLQSFATSAHTLKLWARNTQLIYTADNSKRETTYLNPKIPY